ncbi:11919_t:CDS:1, partial [Dentiscutata heterogama]
MSPTRDFWTGSSSGLEIPGPTRPFQTSRKFYSVGSNLVDHGIKRLIQGGSNPWLEHRSQFGKDFRKIMGLLHFHPGYGPVIRTR